MAEDITRRLLRRGQERAEVVALLGKPDMVMDRGEIVRYWGPQSPIGARLDWTVGTWSRDPIDGYGITVEFDLNGRLTKAEITQY
jgi:hypothetical protein